METSQPKPKKVHVSLSITKEAQDILFDWGYASERTVGAFVSELIVEHHQRVQQAKSQAPPTRGSYRFGEISNAKQAFSPVQASPSPFATLSISPED